MKLESIFSTGDDVEVRARIDGKEHVFTTSLSSLIDRNKVSIHARVSHGKIHNKIASDDQIQLVSKQNTSGIVMLSGRVIKSQLVDDGISFVVEIENSLEQIQRRQYFRLPLFREVEVVGGKEIYAGTTQNISAGGLSCIISNEAALGEKVKVRLNINNEILEMTGKVLGVDEMESNVRRCTVRVCFVDISEKTRSKLISYVLREQSRMHRFKIT